MGAHVAFPLPRKLFTGADGQSRLARNEMLQWTVHPACIALWASNKASGRQDTFIGMIDTDTWKIYAAPCFGITANEALLKLGRPGRLRMALSANEQHRRGYSKAERKQIPETDSLFMADVKFLNAIKEQLDDHHDLPDDLVLVSGSTSTERDATRTFPWSTIKAVYGPHGACLVLFEKVASGFDGKSHQALNRWVGKYTTPKPADNWYSRALGFAIHRDALGYYVRFSSTLNLKPGMSGSGNTFTARADEAKGEGRESRDMPKEWAQRLVIALANDLHVGYFPQEAPLPSDRKDRTKEGKFFGRMVSRGEAETTKYKRLT
jgi:hypothetical protein